MTSPVLAAPDRQTAEVEGDVEAAVAPRATRKTSRTLLAALLSALLAGGIGFVVPGLVDRDTGETPPESSVDVGFLRDMSDHHDQAVRLAVIELDRGESRALQGMALDTVALQRHEIGLMEARLVDWGHGRGDLPRDAMAWMGMAAPVTRMPGMATEADIASFAAATGADADRAFVRLMTAHHVGGIHMAERAARDARTPMVRELAERIAKTQQLEVVDLDRAAAQLGL